jgi:hypothetical protein
MIFLFIYLNIFGLMVGQSRAYNTYVRPASIFGSLINASKKQNIRKKHGKKNKVGTGIEINTIIRP